MDHDQDPGLCAVDERAADAISACIRDGPVACIQVFDPAFHCISRKLAEAMSNWLGWAHLSAIGPSNCCTWCISAACVQQERSIVDARDALQRMQAQHLVLATRVWMHSIPDMPLSFSLQD